MKNTIKLWMDCGYKIGIQDVREGRLDGFIHDFDDMGIAIQLCKNEPNSIKVVPWTSILKIERC